MPILGYWKIRGLAAPIRYMFYQLGVEFEDVTYQVGEAPDFDKNSWNEAKYNLGLEYPNLPYLIDGETKLTETIAIMQYVAKKYCPALLGSTAPEVGRISMLCDKVLVLKDKATMACYYDGDALTITNECRPLLEKLLNVMENSNWIAGQKLSWLDFYFAELIEMLNTVSEGVYYTEFPSLKAYWLRFLSLPNMSAAWSDDIKCMKTPYNNPYAKLLNQ